MAGMKFEYDESGGKFYYFILSVYALILVPASFWLWPSSEKKKATPHAEDLINFAPCREKFQLLHATEPNRKRRTTFIKILFVVAWIIFAVLAYRVSTIEIEHKEYDPFSVLNVDREASVSEIKKAYRDLSKKFHPDRGGDAEQFKEIAKAYKTLTDEEARENWIKYGNPDGPGVTHFGIALPVWLVDHQNSLFVLLVYAGIFMIVLPVIICLWWQKSARYAGDQILTESVRIFCHFFTKTQSITVRRILMILSSSKEFNRAQNPLIIERPSDNIELPKLFRVLTDVQEKTKEMPFQAPYCVKARTLLHAHLSRLDTLSEDLKKDKQYIVRRCPCLINEMIIVQAQLVFFARTGQVQHAPRLDTIENTMKLSAMIVQATWGIKSSMLQLPHISESHIRYFETKKRAIKSIRQLAAMKDEERRSMLRSITDEQYDDIMKVVAIYPCITMTVSCAISDDEDEQTITAGDVVTLTVHLIREDMSSISNKESINYLSTSANLDDEEVTEENLDEKENRNKNQENPKAQAKGWTNKSDKKKKTSKDKNKNKKKPSKTTKPNAAGAVVKPANEATATTEIRSKDEEKDSSDDDSSKHSDNSSTPATPIQTGTSRVEENESETENNDEELSTKVSQKNEKDNDKDDDTFLERFQQQQRRREKLETKEKISHRVFCPFYPEVKQECWWLYVADRKTYSLISAPVYLCTLKDKEEVEVKFSAPKVPGHYVYSVILRSDSYLDVDVTETLTFDVQEAKKMTDDHPQWNFSEEEGSNNKAEDEEYATESDSD